MIWLNQNYNIIGKQCKYLKIYVNNLGNYIFSPISFECLFFSVFLPSLSKSTPNSSTAPSTPRVIPILRTATVKFDYDASDHNELSVLAKEVKGKLTDRIL